MRIVIIGAGRAGSHVAFLLAERHPDWSFVLFDGDVLEEHNLPNHQLREAAGRWLSHPKAEGVAIELAERFGADVEYVTEPFEVSYLDQGNLFAGLIYEKDFILALTDDIDAQLQASVAAAELEIPFACSLVFADGSGEVYLQLDPDTSDCYGCFSLPRRRMAGAPARLRGRDLAPGVADHVDQFLVELVDAYLTRSGPLLGRLLGMDGRAPTTAWRVLPAGHGNPLPIRFEHDTGCPVCGEEARWARGVGRFPTHEARRVMRAESRVLLAARAASLALAAGLIALFLAKPGTGHWILPGSVSGFLIGAGHIFLWPSLLVGGGALVLDVAIWLGYLGTASARRACLVQLPLTVALAAPIALLVVQVALIATAIILVAVLVFAIVIGEFLVVVAAG